MKRVLQSLFLTLFLMAPLQAKALVFSVHQNDSKTLTAVLAEGPVESGDTQRLVDFLNTLPRKKTTAVYLASPGGSLYEGMNLGMFFSQNRIKTIVEGGEDCASACALAFLGGTDNNGDPWRSSSDNSRLGFHAFSNPDQQVGNSNDIQSVVADVLAYGKNVDAPLEILIINFATPSHDIYWLSQEEICYLKIRLWSNTSNKFVC